MNFMLSQLFLLRKHFDLRFQIDNSGNQILNLDILLVDNLIALHFLLRELLLHDAGTLRIDIFLQSFDINFELLLKTKVLLFPHLSLLEQLLVEVDSRSAMAFTDVLGHFLNRG